jgi:hypothetical protein
VEKITSSKFLNSENIQSKNIRNFDDPTYHVFYDFALSSVEGHLLIAPSYLSVLVIRIYQK